MLQPTQTLALDASLYNFVAIYANPRVRRIFLRFSQNNSKNFATIQRFQIDIGCTHLSKECKKSCSISYRSSAIRPLTKKSVKTIFPKTWQSELFSSPDLKTIFGKQFDYESFLGHLHKGLAETSRRGSLFASLVHCVHPITENVTFSFFHFHNFWMFTSDKLLVFVFVLKCTCMTLEFSWWVGCPPIPIPDEPCCCTCCYQW